jgi:hypothetical protein
VSLIEGFFEELDRRWDASTAGRIPLRVIGSTALMLQTEYERGTKDGDVLQTSDLTDDITKRLLVLAGPGTFLHTKHRVYIEIVPNGFPFLPQTPMWIAVPALAQLRSFDVRVLSVVDVVVSKLKRFHANDAADIEAMIEAGRVPHDELITRFRDAVDYWQCDARAEDLPACVANLHRIERDFFDVDETEIELPSWI